MKRFLAFGSHLLLSLLIALAVIAFTILYLYPEPFFSLSNAYEILLLIVCVDVVIGPILTLVVFNTKKQRGELLRDLFCIFLLQISALGYGLYSLYQGRPVLVAFEGDRFRPVYRPEIDVNDVKYEASLDLLPAVGVKPIATNLLTSSDAGYLESLQLAIQGLHPAFRPSRWILYDEQKRNVLESAKKTTEQSSFLKNESEFKAIADQHNLSVQQLSYLPLVTDSIDKNWIVILNGDTAEILGYLPINGWE